MIRDDGSALRDAFNEVIAFAESGPPLEPRGPFVGPDAVVIDSFAEAQEFAYRRCLTADEDAYNWLDLRANQGVDDAPRSVEELDACSVRRMALTNHLYEVLPGRLPTRYADIVDDVVGDLGNCAYFRAVFDRIWNAYRQGYGPCGWIGDYPAGTLVVFAPT